jgi:hercynylcysteine S-oxide lyase
MGNPPSFGHSMRQACFNFAPDYVPLNHGSFGTYPTSVFKQLQASQRDSEARPDHFIRYEIPQKLDESRGAIASLLRVPVAEVVFVPNVTTGVNTVLRSLRFQPGDVIVYFSTIYSACERTVEYLIESTPVQGEKVDLLYPIADDEVVRRFEEALTKLKIRGKNARVAMFDTVSSVPGVRVPWERLVESCRNTNVMSMIDGAHGVGHLSLTHLKKVDPDFFVSNCHK